jgi:hypothetical protein
MALPGFKEVNAPCRRPGGGSAKKAPLGESCLDEIQVWQTEGRGAAITRKCAYSMALKSEYPFYATMRSAHLLDRNQI